MSWQGSGEAVGAAVEAARRSPGSVQTLVAVRFPPSKERDIQKLLDRRGPRPKAERGVVVARVRFGMVPRSAKGQDARLRGAIRALGEFAVRLRCVGVDPSDDLLGNGSHTIAYAHDSDATVAAKVLLQLFSPLNGKASPARERKFRAGHVAVAKRGATGR